MTHPRPSGEGNFSETGFLFPSWEGQGWVFTQQIYIAQLELYIESKDTTAAFVDNLLYKERYSIGCAFVEWYKLPA